MKDTGKTKSKVVSLKHIAERVGVSRMTVSLALRDDGRIPEATRERVCAVAHALGYTANPRIGELMAETARSGHGLSGETLAFVTCEPTRDGWKQFDNATFERINQRAADHGYRLEPWWLADPSKPPARINQIIWSRGIKGVIIPNISRKFFADWGGTLPIEWDRFCVVDIGGGLRRPLVNQVFHDHQAGLFMALDELEALGYQRIGLCLRSEDDQRTHHRWSGAYLTWRALRGHKASLWPLVTKELTPTLLRQWVRQNRLEAVVSPGVQPLEALKSQVPHKLGFASLHLWGERAERVSGIDQQRDETDAAAVDMLVTLLRRKQKGAPANQMRWMQRGRWVAGETTRQIRPVRMHLVGIENELLTLPSV